MPYPRLQRNERKAWKDAFDTGMMPGLLASSHISSTGVWVARYSKWIRDAHWCKSNTHDQSYSVSSVGSHLQKSPVLVAASFIATLCRFPFELSTWWFRFWVGPLPPPLSPVDSVITEPTNEYGWVCGVGCCGVGCDFGCGGCSGGL